MNAAALEFYDRLLAPNRVRDLFDRYAPQFDASMARLGYAGPRILAELVDREMPGRDQLRVLDLGCGTGLAGAAFRTRAARLDGADLSPAMVAKARARGIYDALEVADLLAALEGAENPYDLILAADVLPYLGDLSAAVMAAGERLTPGGHFCFTVEATAGEGYEQGPWRRWLHSEPYVREVASAARLEVAQLVSASARQNFGEPVAGFAVALRRPVISSEGRASGGPERAGVAEAQRSDRQAA